MKKQGGQLPARPAARAGRPGPAPASRAVRRAERHERQARTLAAGFLAGHRGLVGGITAAPVSAFHLPGSTGQPLDGVLRESLELAFGADLRALRIHTDTFAAASAEAWGAAAYAGGAHIAFGPGRYRPDTDAGRELIAHEVAHTLQQAGRAAAGGGLRLDDVHGVAPPQCDDLPDFDTLKRLHAPPQSGSGRAAYDGVAALLDGLVRSTDPQVALATYADGVTPTLKALKWPHHAESLLYDTCKRHGLFDQAAALIERDDFLGGNRVNTVGFSHELVEALERRNGGWAVHARALGAVSWLKAYERDWLAQIEELAMGTLRATPKPLPRSAAKPGQGDTLYDHLLESHAEAFEYQRVGHNEWIHRGLMLMYDLDGRRVHDSGEMQVRAQQGAGNKSWTFAESRALAREVVQWGADLHRQVVHFVNIGKRDDVATIATALKPYLVALGARVSAIGKKALAIWEAAVSLEDMLHPTADTDAAALAAVTTRRDRVGALGTRLAVPKQLAGVLIELNRAEAGGSRTFDSVVLRERVKPLLTQLDDLRARLSQGRVAAFRAGQVDEALDWIALDAFIARLRSHLGWASSESTSARAGRPAVSTGDEAVYQRINIAQWVRSVANPLGWTAAVAASEAILAASLEAQSLIAIQSHDDGDVFKRQSLATEDLVTQAREDFGSHPIRGWEPITLDALMIFYRAAYYEDLARQLRLLRPGGNAAEQDIVKRNAAVPYLINDAKRLLNTAHPQRWSVAGSRYAPKPGDARDFGDVLRAHPAFQALVQSSMPAGFTNVVPIEPTQVFVWFLPPVAPMQELLRTSPMFQGIVAATFSSRLGPPERLKQQQDLGTAEWLDRLQKKIAEDRKKPGFVETDWPGLVMELYLLSSGKYTAALGNFRNEFIWAMRRDRQLIAGKLLLLLQRYADDRHEHAAIAQAVREVQAFNGANAALEDGDREIQVALLLLEVAPALEAALEHEQAFRIVFPMLGFIEVALARIERIRAQPVATRSAWLPDHENSDAWIDRQRVLLETTATRLRAVREAQQKESGFRADKEAQTITSFVKLSSPLAAGTPLRPRYGGFLGDPSAQAYRVMEIHRSFFYHPAYGIAPSRFEAAQPSGYAPVKFMEPDDRTELAARDDEPLLTVQVLAPAPAVVQGGPPGWKVIRTVQVTRKDLVLLDDLHNGIVWAGFGSAMGNIQAGIESVLEFYLDVAELLPGVGPAIAAARITVALTDFLTSADYEAMLQVASGDLIDVVSGLMNSLTQHVDADQLILLLLFGDPRLEMVLARSTLGADKPKSSAAPSSGGQFTALKKTMDAFRRLGRAVFKALRKLDRYVEHPMQDMRVYASTRPLLSFSLQFAADHIFQIVSMVKTITVLIAELDKAGGDNALVAQLETDLKEQQKGFGTKLHDVLKAIEEFKLPHTIIDISPVIASVLTLAESYVIKRTGFAGKVINLALKHSGAYDLVNEHFAQSIVAAGADPNIYWREKVLPQIETSFNDARKALVDRVNEVLASKVMRGVFEPVAAVPPMKVSADTGQSFEDTHEAYQPGADEPNVAPLPSPDRPLIPNPSAVPDFGAGRPLPSRHKGRLEGQMGQDFSHVRLHDDAVGQAMTQAFGADALTSGSHVFVRQGKTQETLGHELVHVVQQTGARPLGRPHDPTPVRGHPERGLDYRPDNEAQAHEVARAMRGGSSPGLGGVGRPAGLQPSGVNWFTIARLFRSASDLEAVTASADKIGKAGPAVLASDVQGAVDKVLAVLKSPSQNAALWRHPGPFKNAMPLVEARLANAPYAGVIAQGAKTIASMAMEPVDAKPGDPKYLAATHFERQLEAFVLAKTGLSLAISLHGKRVSVPGKDFDAVDLTQPVKQIALVHIHLPFMDGRAPLWGAAIDGTWPTATADHKAKLRHALRPLLESKGIVPGVWPLFGKDFRFSLLFTAEAEAYLKARQGHTPDPVPPWEEYVKTEKDAPGNVGLRLSHYDHDTSQKRVGRESHHLTQYLVAEFFANSNDARAFDGTRDYPGVRAVGAGASKPLGSASVGTIADDDAGTGAAVDVNTTKGQGRGATMPTISLAATTHQKGKLHVTPEADDVNGGTRKSQGTALKNEFQRRLPPAVVSPDPGTYKAYVQQQGRDAVAKQIFRAVQQTYTVVEHHMSTQLAKNMPHLEFQYYSSLVEDTPQDIADKTDPDKETDAQKKFKAALAAIPAVAKKHNHTEMVKYGWGTP